MHMADKPVRTMVCVKDQRNYEKLIREGMRLSAGEAMIILHIVHAGMRAADIRSDSDALGYLYDAARRANAEMVVRHSDDVLKTVEQAARSNQIECIVIGLGRSRSGISHAAALRAHMPDMDVRVI